MPQVTFLGSQQGLTADVRLSLFLTGSNQQFSFALTTLPTANTVVAHMSFLFTLNKEKQKLFSAEHSACGRGYLQCDCGTLPFSLWLPGDFFSSENCNRHAAFYEASPHCLGPSECMREVFMNI